MDKNRYTSKLLRCRWHVTVFPIPRTDRTHEGNKVSLKISQALSVGLFATLLTLTGPAHAVDWSKVEAKKIMMMYPAQTSWERLMTQERHSGRRRFLEGKNCLACHGNIDEHPLGESLVHAERFKEPTPIPNKPGFLDAQVKIAHDSENLYVRLEFDPGNQPNAGMDMDFETKVTMLLDDGNTPDAPRAGCWVACHDNVESMARGKPDVTKFLFATREPGSGGNSIFDQATLDKMKAAGQYMEYWQARFNADGKAVPADGIILAKRTDNLVPTVKAEAVNAKGIWTVTLSRKLTGAGENHQDIVPGKTYTIGFAVHAGHTAKRFHYVSFERTMTLDKGSADFVAQLK
jgi:hypothetical protein